MFNLKSQISKTNDMRSITSCRICKSKNLKTFFDLGKQPLANSLLKNPDQKEKFYPLSLSFCHECSLVQLNQTVNPKELFLDYIWVTQTSNTARKFSKIFYQQVIKRVGRFNDSYILEVGSNDGTFLIPFVKNGFNVLGVDPAKNLVEIANRNGIPSESYFWGSEAAKKILEKFGPAKIVIARNVLPHVANTRDFVSGLKTCLSEDGILIIEVHWAKVIQEELHYDSIYHEHLCYFTLKTLEKLLNDFNLYIFDVDKSPISGGSIIVYVIKKKTKENPKVKRFRDLEKKRNTNDFKSWKSFARKSRSHSKKLSELIKKASKKGRIVGYGASARSSTLLNFCEIDSKIISMIADQNPLKQNYFTSGSHILIENPGNLVKQNPKFVVILAWNFIDEITKYLKEISYKGKLIIPLPNEPKIIQI